MLRKPSNRSPYPPMTGAKWHANPLVEFLGDSQWLDPTCAGDSSANRGKHGTEIPWPTKVVGQGIRLQFSEHITRYQPELFIIGSCWGNDPIRRLYRTFHDSLMFDPQFGQSRPEGARGLCLPHHRKDRYSSCPCGLRSKTLVEQVAPSTRARARPEQVCGMLISRKTSGKV
jgi:hypothetical protein